MQESSINVRAVVIYGLVGLAILALIIFGISWAKDRSNQLAGQNQDQASQDEQGGNSGNGGNGGDGGSGGDGQTASNNNGGNSDQASQGDGSQSVGQQGGNGGDGQAVANNNASGNGGSGNNESGTGGQGGVSGTATTGPTQVPAAGSHDWVLFLAGLVAASYMAVKFWQSRRALASLR